MFDIHKTRIIGLPYSEETTTAKIEIMENHISRFSHMHQMCFQNASRPYGDNYVINNETELEVRSCGVIK